VTKSVNRPWKPSSPCQNGRSSAPWRVDISFHVLFDRVTDANPAVLCGIRDPECQSDVEFSDIFFITQVLPAWMPIRIVCAIAVCFSNSVPNHSIHGIPKHRNRPITIVFTETRPGLSTLAWQMSFKVSFSIRHLEVASQLCSGDNIVVTMTSLRGSLPAHAQGRSSGGCRRTLGCTQQAIALFLPRPTSSRPIQS